jgi:Protein of unknown function (DUF2759)
MGTVIIFALVTLLALYGVFSSLKNRNILGLVFALATVAVFGFFTIMTIIDSGYPTAH